MYLYLSVFKENQQIFFDNSYITDICTVQCLLKSIFYKNSLENPSAYKVPQMSRIFLSWIHGIMRLTRGNFEVRWIFQEFNPYIKWTLLEEPSTPK